MNANRTMTQQEYTQMLADKYGRNSMAGLDCGEVLDLYAKIQDLTEQLEAVCFARPTTRDPRTPAQICDDERDADYAATIAAI